MFLGYLKDVEEGNQVVAIIHDWFCYRLADSLECRKMNDCINVLFCKQSVHCIKITAINLIERDVFPAGDLLYSLKTGEITIRHVVCYNYFIASSDKFYSHVTADIAGSSGY